MVPVVLRQPVTGLCARCGRPSCAEPAQSAFTVHDRAGVSLPSQTNMCSRTLTGMVVRGWQPSLLDGGAPWIEAGSLERATRTTLGEDAWVDVVPGWLHGADALFEAVLAAAPWEAHELPMYGQLMPSPRLSARWAAGPHDPALPPVIGDAATLLSERYGHEFASVGANLYRDGSDSVAWHGDRVLAHEAGGGRRGALARRHPAGSACARRAAARRSRSSPAPATCS